MLGINDGMKIRLQTSQPATEDYLMIGLSTAMADYRLSHLLNNQFQAAFRKRPDIPFYNKSGLIGYFPFYHYFNEDIRVDYYLFGNKNQEKTALSDYKHFEFFILFKLSAFSIPEQEILSELRRLQGISAALKIPLQNLKSFDEILEDLELHLMEINSSNQKDAMRWLWNNH